MRIATENVNSNDIHAIVAVIASAPVNDITKAASQLRSDIALDVIAASVKEDSVKTGLMEFAPGMQSVSCRRSEPRICKSLH